MKKKVLTLSACLSADLESRLDSLARQTARFRTGGDPQTSFRRELGHWPVVSIAGKENCAQSGLCKVYQWSGPCGQGQIEILINCICHLAYQMHFANLANAIHASWLQFVVSPDFQGEKHVKTSIVRNCSCGCPVWRFSDRRGLPQQRPLRL